MISTISGPVCGLPSPERRRRLCLPRCGKVFHRGAILLALAASLVLPGCQGRTAPVLLDEAFTAARPGLAARFRGLQKGFPGQGGVYAEISLARGPETLVEEARKAGYAAAGKDRSAIVTSPLLAAALVAGEKALGLDGSATQGSGIQALGGLGLVVPEWQGGRQAQITPVNTEPSKAFEAAGRAAGAFVAALRGSGQGSATGGILFRETPSRGREALEAFSNGFVAMAGVAPAIEILGRADTMDESAGSVARLLAADLRIVLVATGRDARALCKSLERPGLALGIESTDPAAWPGAAFSIAPDDDGIARAAIAAASRPGRAPGSGPEAIAVPALLLAGSGAGGFEAGGTDLGRLLAGEGAGRRRRGS